MELLESECCCVLAQVLHPIRPFDKLRVRFLLTRGDRVVLTLSPSKGGVIEGVPHNMFLSFFRE